jgi:hypothetical protein
MGPTDWLEAAKAVGPTVIFLAFFTWWSFIREKALARRLNEVETSRVEDLKTVVTNNTAAMTNLTQELHLRPCLDRRKGAV